VRIRGRLLVLGAALAALAASGCGSKKAAAPAPEKRVRATGDWLRRRPEGAAGPAARPPAWARAEKLPEMELRPMPRPEVEAPKSTAEILGYLNSKGADRRILGLIAVWKKRPPEAVEVLVAMARRDPVFARPAVEALSAYPDPVGTRALVSALSSRRPEARAAAAGGLARRRVRPGGPVEKALARAVRRDRDWRVRAGAALALGFATRGRYGAGAELALMDRMGDARELHAVRLECAAALARGGVNSGWRHLQAAAFSRESNRAVLALKLCGEVGGRRGAAVLGAALRNDRPEIWIAAVKAFGMVGRGAALEALAARVKGGGRLGRRAALALAPFEGRRLVPEVLLAMEKGSSIVRAAGCEVLARALGADASAALERKLLDGGEAQRVRAAAARQLGQVGGPVVAASLRKVAKDDADAVVRAVARDALLLVEARLKKGSGAVSRAEAERLAFSRWRLVAVLPGRLTGCRLRDARGRERVYRVGDEVALGYRLARVLGAGQQAEAAEVLLAGRAATRLDLLRAVLTKGDRAVVLVARAVRAEK